MLIYILCLHSQNKHGKHLIRWTFCFFNIYRYQSERWITNGDCTKRSLNILSGWDTSRGTHHTAPQDPTKVETYVSSMWDWKHVYFFPKRTNKQLGERSPSGLNIPASTPTKRWDKKWLPWHAIGNHRTVILNIQLPETPEMSHMSKFDKLTLFSESDLVVNSILELKFCNLF